MARILTRGFESGVLTHEVNNNIGGLLNNTIRRTGAYSLQISSNYGWAEINLDTVASTEIYGGYAYMTANQRYGECRCRIINSAGNTLGEIDYVASSERFTIACNGLTDTPSIIFASGAWHYVEFHLLIDDVSGIFSVKVNGSTISTLSGDTYNVSYGMSIYRLEFYAGNYGYPCIDDLVVNDTTTSFNNSWPGVVKLYPILPNAAGDVTGLTRGGTDTGNNYSQVNEVPASSTQYVYQNTVDAYDLYNFGTLTLPTGYTVRNVVSVVDGYMASGSGGVTTTIKSGGTEQDGSDHTLSGSSFCHTDAFPQTPAGASWTQSDIDAIQAGPKVR